MKIRELAEGLGFPEGPVALAPSPRSEASPVGMARAALGPDGKCYICNNGGFRWHIEGSHRRPLMQADDYSGGRIERIDLATGAVEILYRTAGEVPLKGPNDLVFDAQGGFYFSDLGKVRSREMDRGAVYYAKPDGSFITEVAFPMVTPNGVGLSPDEKTLYVAETESARLWAFDIVEPGVVNKQPWPSPHGGRLVAGVGGYQRFDSLALDAEGRICVATLVNRATTVISPDGRHVEHHPMPDLMTTNICFGWA